MRKSVACEPGRRDTAKMSVTPEEPVLEVRASIGDDELNALYTASWPAPRPMSFERQRAYSLSWVSARRNGILVGFVYVATDGDIHAFLLDPTVHPDERGRGLGTRLVQAATEASRAAGVEWLHIDYEPHLAEFYAGCGFRPTPAGLIRLDE